MGKPNFVKISLIATALLSILFAAAPAALADPIVDGRFDAGEYQLVYDLEWTFAAAWPGGPTSVKRGTVAFATGADGSHYMYYAMSPDYVDNTWGANQVGLYGSNGSKTHEFSQLWFGDRFGLQTNFQLTPTAPGEDPINMRVDVVASKEARGTAAVPPTDQAFLTSGVSEALTENPTVIYPNQDNGALAPISQGDGNILAIETSTSWNAQHFFGTGAISQDDLNRALLDAISDRTGVFVDSPATTYDPITQTYSAPAGAFADWEFPVAVELKLVAGLWGDEWINPDLRDPTDPTKLLNGDVFIDLGTGHFSPNKVGRDTIGDPTWTLPPVTPQAADLSLTKSVDNATPNLGDTITYTVTVSNAGPDSATNVAVEDVLPSGVSYVSDAPTQGSYAAGIWTVGTIANGGSATITIDVTVGSGDYDNIAQVNASDQADPDSTPDNDVPGEDDQDSASTTPIPQGTVFGHIFEDTNGDGVQDAGEPDLAGVDVVITDSAGIEKTVTTDANGDYSATVPSGSTTADVDENTLPVGVTQTAGSDPSTVDAIAGQDTDIGDDGYQPPAGTVTGHVYEDTNGNGVQDAGEPNLPGVDVVITDSAGTAQTVTTDANGDYSATVPAGETSIDIVDATLPADVTQTQGTDATAVTVPSGGTASDIDGYQPPPGTVTGHVYEDTNGNGVQDAGEPDLAGVDVVITDSAGNSQTVTTDTNGDYSATVPAGETSIDIVDATLPAGVTQSEGTDTTTVTVPSGGTASDIDGYQPPAGTVTGHVYEDTNGNGVQDAGEPNLPGVDVVITDSAGNPQTVTTDANGDYSATVPAGDTTIDIVDATLPADVTQTQGTDATTVTVPSGGTASDIDGYQPPPGTVNVSKQTTFEGADASDRYLWLFGIYDANGVELASDITASGDTVLDFGEIDLSPSQDYTLCELGMPAGWSSIWRIDTDDDGVADATALPYNPNQSDVPPEDLGNRCYDFTVSAGGTLVFEILNQYPGGGPRTPGYWKNWNRITGGGQAENAERNGGWAEGFWLLEDVLDPDVGGDITWDNLLDDTFLFDITDPAVTVDILDQREIGVPNVAGDGVKHANDAAYTLAMHLLAAQLNFGAGAESCDAVRYAALDGEELLDKYNFDGTGDYLLSKNRRVKADYNLALELATELDLYNNGELCTGPSVPILNPANGRTLTSEDSFPVTIKASVLDVTVVTQVEFFVDGVSLGVDIDGSDGWTMDWDWSGETDGSYPIMAVATNESGETGSAEVVVNVEQNAADAPPTVGITSPADGTTINGASVEITAGASDDSSVTQVEFFIDGESVGVGSYDVDGWSAFWDLTDVTDGEYIITATATDDASQTASSSIVVTVDNVEEPLMHVGDLNASTATGKGGKWNATVTATVHDDSEVGVAGATVSGAWSGGATGTCVTDGSGQCSITLGNINKNTDSVSFTVDSITGNGFTYASSDNHDPDGDSDGTTIVVAKP